MESQMAEKELTLSKPQSSGRWGPPITSAKLNLLHKEHSEPNRLVSLCVVPVVVLTIKKSCQG